MNQFPTAFQFNQAYLVKMVQHVYSNLFGTFLLNTVQERTSHRIAERSHSLWNFLFEKRNEYCNYLYEFSEEVYNLKYFLKLSITSFYYYHYY